MAALHSPPSDADSKNRILSAEDAADLRHNRLLQTTSESGSQQVRIHKRRLNSSSDEEYGHLLIPPPLLAPPSSTEEDDPFATIPAQLISEETLLYVGYTQAKATEMWREWTSWSEEDRGEITFLKWMTACLLHAPNTDSENDGEWISLMTSWGINDSVQESIMHPEFRYLRLSQSCSHWTLDTIEIRYASLVEIQETSRLRDMRRHRVQLRGGGDVGASMSSCGRAEGARSVSSEQRAYAPGFSTNLTTKALMARNAPGKITLYKSDVLGRLRGLFDDSGAIAKMSVLLGGCPSDFSRLPMYYFTPSFNIAQCYARYSKRRGEQGSTVILSIDIPNHAIKSLVEPAIQKVYWPAPEWKDLVWNCRRNQKPSHLRKYRDAALIIGTTARKPCFRYQELTSPEGIEDNHVLRADVNGYYDPAMPAGVQYAFSEDKGEDFLEEHAQNPRVAPYTFYNLGEWLDRSEAQV